MTKSQDWCLKDQAQKEILALITTRLTPCFGCRTLATWKTIRYQCTIHKSYATSAKERWEMAFTIILLTGVYQLNTQSLTVPAEEQMGLTEKRLKEAQVVLLSKDSAIHSKLRTSTSKMVEHFNHCTTIIVSLALELCHQSITITSQD